MNERPLAALLALVLLAIAGYYVFPGHTYLQQDSQIYLPMMERLLDGRLLGNDLIATHPHLSFTLYDELAVAAKWITGLDFEPILAVQQGLTRLLGLWGVFLLARSAQISSAGAVLVAAIFGLGATVVGPSVLTVEYEPTPRAFALPLILLAAGLAAHKDWKWAGVAAAAGFLYHPPTVLPVLALLCLYLWMPWRADEAEDRRWFFLALAIAVALLVTGAKWQAGTRIAQEFFWRIPPDIEQMQRTRASYNWVGIWFGGQWLHYLLLLGVGVAAHARIGRRMEGVANWLFGALPWLGLLSLLASFVLLDGMRWGLMPQLQPGRALLWTVFCAVVGASMAGLLAESLWESALWLVTPLAVVVQTRPFDLLAPFQPTRLVLVVGLALAAGLIAKQRWGEWAPGAWALAAMLLITQVGGVRNYPSLHSPELDGLSAWARSATPIDAVFHFPDAGKNPSPGIFRARALRAVYVDWKGGGQVNFMPSLAREWWRRWESKERPVADYDVFMKPESTGLNPVFRNAKFAVTARVSGR